MMRTLWNAVLIVILLLVTASLSQAFILRSPPLRQGTMTSLRCSILNFASATKDMNAQITFLNRFGVETVSNLICSSVASPGSGHRVSCTAITIDPDVRGCIFTVTGVNRDDVRASVEILDASDNPLTALEAR